MTVKISVDDGDHTVTPEQVQLPGSSMRNFRQKDADCASENSFRSDFGDDPTDEEDWKATGGLDGRDIESDPPPPVYSEEECPQSMFLLAKGNVNSPPMVLQYTPPTGLTEVEPTFKVNLSGPSMCVVRGSFSTRHCYQLTDMLGLQSLTCLQSRWSFLPDLQGTYMYFQNTRSSYRQAKHLTSHPTHWYGTIIDI